MKEAYLYKPASNSFVDCQLCNRHCHIPVGGVGNCGVRVNAGGKLYAMTYAKPVSIAMDPIEKKPLFHFLPGTHSLSIATVGCNFHCLFCQNSEISQVSWKHSPEQEVLPDEIVRIARDNNAPSISYTYTEPTVFYEYAKDTSVLAHEFGLRNVFVTNGYMTREMLKDYKELDAANVDLKGNNEFYQKVCGGVDREKVLESIKLMCKNKVWVEITMLIIPGYNDDDESIQEIADFVKNTNADTPLHFSAFFPHYKMKNVPPTPRESLVRARELALEAGVKYVYCGNTFPGDPFENTYCPNCGEILIQRHGFSLLENKLTKSKCSACGTKIAGVWN